MDFKAGGRMPLQNTDSCPSHYTVFEPRSLEVYIFTTLQS